MVYETSVFHLMINQDTFKDWFARYNTACEAGRKSNITSLMQAQDAFREAWGQWSLAPEKSEGLFGCIKALKCAIDIFSGIFNHTYVFGGKRGKHSYGMLGVMATDLDDEAPGTGARAVYEMFSALYADGDIQERYRQFDALAEERVAKLKSHGQLSEGAGHLQGPHPATVYCWLHDPLQNYYFFTNEIVKLCAQQLSGDTVVGRKEIFLQNAYTFLRDVKEAIRQASPTTLSEQELSAITCDFVDFTGTQIRETQKQPKVARHWLLVAKPSVWSFEQIKVDEETEYTMYNEDGNKRNIFSNFEKVREGDPVVCYESSPTRAVVALAEISAASDGSCIRIRKTQQLDTPLPLDELTKHPETKDRFEHIQGSLFDMTHAQYDAVLRLTKLRAGKKEWHPKGNLIRFGAPGTGKSYLLNQEAESYFAPENTERVTFHPEYTSFDFIGSFKPVVIFAGTSNERVSYGFVPGPFARILKAARSNPAIPHLLIIEEINRANAAAVFADMFQLLDRRKTRESRYSVAVSEEFAAYLGLREGERLVIPHNMYIWATMNSADQGVYPMDTAFKRRWHFAYCDIDEARSALLDCGGYAADWNKLRERANKLLQKAGVNEDKQMGPFFLSPEELQNESDFTAAICNKVLMYLHEDAARHKRSALFAKASLRYSQLCSEFMTAYSEGGLEAAIDEIFIQGS